TTVSYSQPLRYLYMATYPPHLSDLQVREFLNLLESEEARLLTWGVVDAGFTEEDIHDRALQFAEEWQGDGAVDPDGLVDEMLRRRLLFDLPLNGRRVYRT